MLRRIEKPSNNIDNSVEFILRGAKKRRSMAMASARMLTNEQGIQTMLVAVKQSKRAEAEGLAEVQDRNAVKCERSDKLECVEKIEKSRVCLKEKATQYEKKKIEEI